MEATNLYQAFAANIRARRQELGLSQREVARRIGFAHPNYVMIESGRREPGLEVVGKIAAALQTTPGDLLRENLIQAS